MIEQHRILDRVVDLGDGGELGTTLTQTLFSIDATDLCAAHRQLESCNTSGKVALAD